LFLSFSSFYLWRVVRFGLGVRKLWEMHEFFAELLEIPEVSSSFILPVPRSRLSLQNDIQTIPWHVLVSRLSTLRSSHPSALSSLRSVPSASQPSGVVRLDAHDVANRIMREENYLIALFNKDVLDLSIPVPVALRGWIPKSWSTGMLTRTLEWNLSFCLTGFLFGRDGQVRRAFVSERNKKELVEACVLDPITV
jgi:autophagy-related protein 9